MASGMGMPSIAIYSYELFNSYGVKNIIRVGTAGVVDPSLKVRDIVIGMGACTNSNYAAQFRLPGTYAPICSYPLMKKAIEAAEKMGIQPKVGNLYSSDTFYDDAASLAQWQKMGVLATEMEAAALYMNAARAGKKALCMLTISDHLYKDEKLSARERQLGFDNMIQIALDM